jgi:mono/diheme cytochrome c family protein
MPKQTRPFPLARFGLAAGAVATIALVTGSVARPDAPADGRPDNGGATYVGEAVCIACHKPQGDQFMHTAHAAAFRLNPKDELQQRSCEACHGPRLEPSQGSGEPGQPRLAGRLYPRLGHAGRAAKRRVPDLPSGRFAPVLVGLGARGEWRGLQRLPQPDGPHLRHRAARQAHHQRDLLHLPPAAARGVRQALPHAAAGGQDELRRLPQPARRDTKP